MNDRINESLSALMDGEADELEVRRLLNQVEQDDELRDRWGRYQMMAALMRDEQTMTVDLSRGIMQAIDGEPMDEVPGRIASGSDIVESASSEASKATGSRASWLTSGAVAASVTLAVLLGVRMIDQQSTAPSPAVAAVEETTRGESSGTEMLASVAADESGLTQQQLQAAQARLQEYVLQHSEHVSSNNNHGLMPYARVTNFEQEGDALK